MDLDFFSIKGITSYNVFKMKDLSSYFFNFLLMNYIAKVFIILNDTARDKQKDLF